HRIQGADAAASDERHPQRATLVEAHSPRTRLWRSELIYRQRLGIDVADLVGVELRVPDVAVYGINVDPKGVGLGRGHKIILWRIRRQFDERDFVGPGVESTNLSQARL